jgi:SAM-dependent methyltransferase
MAEFTAAVENYDRFMGRYATGLAPKFADAAGVRAGMRVLDVGCGPGALAVELAGRVGEDNVAAIVRVPETRFGLPERVSAGSSGAYLMRLLAVSASHRAGGVALPDRGRERGRDPCFASRVGGASPAGDPTELPSS